MEKAEIFIEEIATIIGKIETSDEARKLYFRLVTLKNRAKNRHDHLKKTGK
jgi:hypothetical protein